MRFLQFLCKEHRTATFDRVGNIYVWNLKKVDYISVPVIPELLRAKVKVFAELHRKSRQLEILNANMIRVQDEERRRLARELHDSVGQLLAAIGMNSSVVEAESHKLSPDAVRRLNENASMAEEISRQIRTISHLLHPPLLDEAGLASALRWYVDGFSGRSGINVKLDMPSELERLPDEVELSIFRIVQECLTNVHRHSGSSSAVIRITHEDHNLRVEVEDEGTDVSRENQRASDATSQTGVGIRGMRERLRSLNGTLEIGSNNHGTQVAATIPLERTITPMRRGAA